MKKIVTILICILSCFLVGFIASQFQTESIETWYPTLNKPPLTPPNYVFPLAWGILYVCMGLSIGLIIGVNSPKEKGIFKLFVLQLALNFLWSISFFYLQNPLLGLINILLLLAVLIIYTIKTYNVVRISSLLFIPYILWVSFATYLNLYILIHN